MSIPETGRQPPHTGGVDTTRSIDSGTQSALNITGMSRHVSGFEQSPAWMKLIGWRVI